MGRWGTIGGVSGASVVLTLWLRSIGVFSVGGATVALQAGGLDSGRGWLGFDVPPLPIFLTAPVALVPMLRWEPLAPAVAGALAAGATAWSLFQSLRALPLGAAASVALTGLGTAHPVWIYAAASGSGTAVAAALLILGLRLYDRWRRTADPLALAGSSFVVGIAGLARYDFFVVGLALAAVMTMVRRTARTGDGATAQGIAYGAGVIGPLGLWLVSSGIGSGDALGFIARAREATLAGPSADLPAPALLVLVPSVALSALALLGGYRGGAVVASIVVAACATVASILSATMLSLDAVVPLVPLSVLVLGEIAATRRVGAKVCAACAALLLAAGIASFTSSTDQGEGHRSIVDSLRGITRPMWAGERAAAAAVQGMSGRVLLDLRADAVPALLIGAPERIVPMEATDPLPTPASIAELILVKTATGPGSADRVGAAWPTLSGGGVGWATFVAAFPMSGAPGEYRLYKVNEVSSR